ncbi:MAG: glycerol-3-phosphate 1-O-acyltransferase PlsY [Candidatus Omnitrophica bacterium]|nr:glycerol-3-phosphate 1-O-acyltransferase PlsY [Candidatus Omnitrophota bacterium]
MTVVNLLFNLLGILISYLIGSIPTGFIIGRLIKGIDIREYGSGNIGATNVLRIFGKLPALLVLFFDIFKGYFVVQFFTMLLNIYFRYLDPICLKTILGFFVVVGHIWPVFLKFRGGKGVATAIGVFLALDLKISFFIFSLWLIILAVFKYVSVSSIVVAIFSPIFFLVFNGRFELILFSSILAFVICLKHRNNIKRLIEGTEKKIGQRLLS